MPKKSFNKRWPEKRKAIHAARKAVVVERGFTRHHWSYSVRYRRDVIILTVPEHCYIHRHLEYIPDQLIYKSPSGELLDTKEKHLAFINQILGR